jgi:hypothetical protein
VHSIYETVADRAQIEQQIYDFCVLPDCCRQRRGVKRQQQRTVSRNIHARTSVDSSPRRRQVPQRIPRAAVVRSAAEAGCLPTRAPETLAVLQRQLSEHALRVLPLHPRLPLCWVRQRADAPAHWWLWRALTASSSRRGIVVRGALSRELPLWPRRGAPLRAPPRSGRRWGGGAAAAPHQLSVSCHDGGAPARPRPLFPVTKNRLIRLFW